MYNELLKHNREIYYTFGQLQERITPEILGSPTFLCEMLYYHIRNQVEHVVLFLERNNIFRRNALNTGEMLAYYQQRLEEKFESQSRDEIEKIKQILDQYVTNNGHMDVSKPLPLSEWPQYEITQAFAIFNRRDPTITDCAEIGRFWLQRTMLEEVLRQFVVISPTVTNQYSTQTHTEKRYSFCRNLTPAYRRILLPLYYVLDLLNYETAFAIKLWHLILELAYNIPHPDIRRTELYVTRHADEIRSCLIYSQELKWKFFICQLLKACVEEIFTEISRVIFYERWNTNDTPRELLDDYYDTRYVTIISAYTAQIIAFFKEQERQLQANQDAYMPDNPGAPGSGSNQPRTSSSRNDLYVDQRQPVDHQIMVRTRINPLAGDNRILIIANKVMRPTPRTSKDSILPMEIARSNPPTGDMRAIIALQ